VHLWLLPLAILAAPTEGELTRFSFRQSHMGVPWEVVFYAADESTANIAAEAAYARIAELERVLSDYDPQSELSRLSESAGGGQPVAVSDDLWVVLQRSQQLSGRTEGAFDITVGPLVRLWRRARRQARLPVDDALCEARAAVGRQFLILNEETRTAELTRPEMRLDAGGIGMGYAVDEALKVLRRQGITRAMIDASGDIGVGDPPPGKEGWRIGIAPLRVDGPPSAYLTLAGAAVTTSGDAFQHVEIDGRRYSHIVDPRTGLGIEGRQAVTVVAPDCTAADSLATAACVLGPKEGLALIGATPGASALFVWQTVDGVQTLASRCWAGTDGVADGE
jgi:thiamine biosynthesis lipoprotein